MNTLIKFNLNDDHDEVEMSNNASSLYTFVVVECV